MTRVQQTGRRERGEGESVRTNCGFWIADCEGAMRQPFSALSRAARTEAGPPNEVRREVARSRRAQLPWYGAGIVHSAIRRRQSAILERRLRLAEIAEETPKGAHVLRPRGGRNLF